MNIEAARQFAHKQMDNHGLVLKGWTFSFNKALTYAGICYEDKKEIRLSKAICEIESDDFIKDTILHEIAHALVGNKHGHDVVWQNCAKKIGTSTDATYVESEAIEKAKLAKTKYVMCFDGKIVQTYLRKPNKKTIANVKNIWMTGRKDETIGKLYIESYNPKIHVEFA